MLDTIKRIRRIVEKTHPRGHLPYQIENIRAAVVEVTDVDRVRFYGFPDDPDNPVKGRFRRHEDVELGVYAGQGVLVEIDYDQSQNFCWTRFIVCKELCHALETDRTVRVNSFPEVEKLIGALRSQNEGGSAAAFPPFMSELTAQFCALELLCPVEDRQKTNAQRTTLSEMEIALAFRIPLAYVRMSFDPTYVDLMARLFSAA